MAQNGQNGQNGKSFALHSLGCKVNQEEGRALAALFLSRGWQERSLDETADVYVINACAVTQTAESKARALLRRLRRRHPQALVALCGCYGQIAVDKDNIPEEADLVAGVEERAVLPELIEKKMAEGGREIPLTMAQPLQPGRPFTVIAATSEQTRARAYLKIEDGCEEFCNYCIVPYARGPVRSLPQEQALAQAAELLAQGHREIVVSGVHIGAYGRDLQDGSHLPTLIRRLAALPGCGRLRLGSIEPQQFTAELLETFATEMKICRHLHIPLQSGCDATLRAMGRKYDTADYAALVEKLRQICPEICITTDIMVGYPGETAAEFEQSRDFCRQMGFGRMHVFPYSQRPGTPAATAPGQIPGEEKKKRAAAMGDTARQLARAYGEKFTGRKLQLLAEQKQCVNGTDYISGHSDNYLPLLLPAAACPHWRPGQFIQVEGEIWQDGCLLTRR
ncbi:MAG: tRNA (N(6)-L-threonylcarbamoyladenosine(37)-C(2))-methylthiotransferase MtaB [Firmicutes bacterium]|nr:tRNA (N(6)-L-threonylcarbamoyladenosine(37)-C(2))-methylthiotransferase MtaB [Bacillota bacterium]